ncbi:hypothetical protein KI387_007124, partial [Taxus chinensis]
VSYLRYGLMIRHVINEKSPVYGLTLESLKKGDASFSLTVMGLERSSMQPIFHLEDYFVSDGEVVWDDDYVDFIHINDKGQRVLDHATIDLLKLNKASSTSTQSISQHVDTTRKNMEQCAARSISGQGWRRKAEDVDMQMDVPMAQVRGCQHAKSRAHGAGWRRKAENFDMKMDAPMAQVRRCRHAKIRAHGAGWRCKAEDVDMQMDAPMAQRNMNRPSSEELFRFRKVPHLGKAPCYEIALRVSTHRVANIQGCCDSPSTETWKVLLRNGITEGTQYGNTSWKDIGFSNLLIPPIPIRVVGTFMLKIIWKSWE